MAEAGSYLLPQRDCLVGEVVPTRGDAFAAWFTPEALASVFNIACLEEQVRWTPGHHARYAAACAAAWRAYLARGLGRSAAEAEELMREALAYSQSVDTPLLLDQLDAGRVVAEYPFTAQVRRVRRKDSTRATQAPQGGTELYAHLTNLAPLHNGRAEPTFLAATAHAGGWIQPVYLTTRAVLALMRQLMTDVAERRIRAVDDSWQAWRDLVEVDTEWQLAREGAQRNPAGMRAAQAMVRRVAFEAVPALAESLRYPAILHMAELDRVVAPHPVVLDLRSGPEVGLPVVEPPPAGW